MRVLLIGKEYSVSARKLRKACGFDRDFHFSLPKAIINYGLQGTQKRLWDKKYGLETKDIPKINHTTQLSKFNVIKIAESLGIPTPETYNHPHEVLKRSIDEFIIKRNWSKKGNGIRPLIKEEVINENEYIQKYMVDRTYEVRVTGTTWNRQKNWAVWKKVNEDNPEQIAWNHDKGGKFIAVNEPWRYNVFRMCCQHTADLMKNLKLQFGAADFLYNKENGVLQFIEINTCPGFTDFSEGYYISIFKNLKQFIIDETKRGLDKWINQV